MSEIDGKEPLYIFIHLPRTGGTTIKETVKANFAADEVLEIYDTHNLAFRFHSGLIKYIQTLSNEQKKKIKFIIGHQVFYGLHNLFPDREPRYVVFLRDPISRVISWYKHYRQLAIKYPYRYQSTKFFSITNKTPSLKEFINHVNKPNNFIIDFLSKAMTIEKKDHLTTIITSVERAKLLLDRCYFVGLTENWTDFMFIFGRLGIHRFLSKQNISHQYFSKVSERSFDQLFKEINFADYELYRYARRLNKRFRRENDYYRTIFKSQIRPNQYGWFRYLYQFFCQIFDWLAERLISDEQKGRLVVKINQSFWYQKTIKKWLLN